MTNEELQHIIEKIVKDAFDRIEYAYQHHRERKQNMNKDKIVEQMPLTRLVFPRYSKDGELSGDTRISEQELRFVFVEAFNASDDVKKQKLFYSIETPTKEKYSGFSSTAKKKATPKHDPSGQSGEFDLVIFNDELERVCLIEFKANNASKIDHEKDLLKLEIEGERILRYFIEVIKAYSESENDGDNKQKTTIESLKEKFKLHNKENKTVIKCYALEGKSIRHKQEEEKTGEDISYKFNK